ncbi:MAG TPA: flagellar basal-body rod protein FlgG [Ideonella sp.]|uniref:flagellar basal-body rod protein FlgG n=1 Tax=Ideonella sp. TaxID=1929293 RepID=UPI002E301E20|nr:flagellar basal-body rod protein FlgG [Ideonella sp.]HEX5682643.1 flagellar basal-body rod protein FlgG [Ideonella sp.]
MFDAFQIAATGMHAQQQNVDAIANNLANVNTTGFKKTRVSFTDLVSRQTEAGANNPAGNVEGAPSPMHGTGVAIAQIARSFDAGEAKKTDSAYDVTIAGDGFIEVVLPDGSRAFTRGGTLRVSADGQLATVTGQALKPNISIPEDLQDLTITPDGRVLIKTARHPAATEVGQLELVRFIAPSALESLGDGLFKATEQAGEPIASRAGQDGVGTIRQGFLEGSNVKLVEEMVNLMVAQRAYEASVKVVQASDEMLGMVNNLRK